MSYESTTHKLNLTGAEISTILYYLDEVSSKWVGKHDEDSLRGNVDRIYAELQSVTDNYYAQLEEENDTLVVENSGKPYTFPLTKRTH